MLAEIPPTPGLDPDLVFTCEADNAKLKPSSPRKSSRQKGGFRSHKKSRVLKSPSRKIVGALTRRVTFGSEQDAQKAVEDVRCYMIPLLPNA
jgi:hypothetical protein